MTPIFLFYYHHKTYSWKISWWSQWLGLCDLAARTWFQSLVGDLGSHKACSTAKNTTKQNKNTVDPWTTQVQLCWSTYTQIFFNKNIGKYFWRSATIWKTCRWTAQIRNIEKIKKKVCHECNIYYTMCYILCRFLTTSN